MNNKSLAAFEAANKEEHPAWFEGNANNFHFSIEEISLSSGGVIRPQVDGVTAIVGSNNAGKSTILRELEESLTNGRPSRKITINSAKLNCSDNISDLFAWLSNNANYQGRSPNNQYDKFVRIGSEAIVTNIEYWWTQRSSGIKDLARFMCFYGDAEGRFSLGASAPKRAETEEPPTHPVHRLEGDRGLRDRLSEISKKVFQQPLTLDSLAGNVRLRVGRTDVTVPPADDISDEYRSAISDLPFLDNQGDGMRSFFGQVLPIMTSNYPVVILDEPEAFLHPPQARALGMELGKLARDNRVQVIVATHDRSFLSGLLDSESDVSVVRVSRAATGGPKARQLDSERLKEIWNDPVLKHTNVLDALFHKVAVLAESEVDCGYLSASLDIPERNHSTVPSSEYLFVQTGGKSRFPKVAEALHAVGVPVVAAPDFDLLNDKGDIRKLLEALGGTWGQDEDSLWDRATAPFRAPRSPLTIGQVLDALEQAFSDRRDDNFDTEAKDLVKIHTRHAESPFAEVKRHGLNAFRSEARLAIVGLLDRIETVGIVPVYAGELECLAPNVVSRKGPLWLVKALEENAHFNKTTQDHIDRIVEVAEHLLQQE